MPNRPTDLIITQKTEQDYFGLTDFQTDLDHLEDEIRINKDEMKAYVDEQIENVAGLPSDMLPIPSQDIEDLFNGVK